MSTLKVNTIRHTGSSSDSITLASDGKCAVTGSTVTADTGKFTNLPKHNILVNGAMNVAQRASSSTSGGHKSVDRWQVSDNNTNVTITQAQHALTSSDTGPWAKGFRHSYHVSLSAAGNSLGSDSGIWLVYGIESQDLAWSGWDYTNPNSYITVSFWFKASTNQTFYGHLRTKDGTEQGYPFSFTASGNDTWTKITQSIPGNSNLQFDNDANIGCQLQLIPYHGGDFSTSGRADKTWAAHSSGTYTPDMANTWITAGTSTFEFTGIQLELGDSSTEFQHKSYSDDLMACQRYYYKQTADSDWGVAICDNDNQWIDCVAKFPVEMRAAPTAVSGSGDSGNYRVRRDSTKTCTGGPTYNTAGKQYGVFRLGSSSHGWSAGDAVRAFAGNSYAFIGWESEI
jgi:hypothetical protein